MNDWQTNVPNLPNNVTTTHTTEGIGGYKYLNPISPQPCPCCGRCPTCGHTPNARPRMNEWYYPVTQPNWVNPLPHITCENQSNPSSYPQGQHFYK
jgi:hypothetical protein